MRRRLLYIAKDPEFDDHGEVVLGQCETFTSGWILVLVKPDRSREMLLSGNYTDLRKIQESCAALEEPEAVKRRVNEMRSLLNSSVTETVAVEFNSEAPTTDVTQILNPTQTNLMPAVPDEVLQTSGDGFFELHRADGVIVALLADPERAGDVVLLNQQLRRLLETKPRAIVLDLNRIQNLAMRAVSEVVLFRDHCAEEQILFGLCNVRKTVRKLFENLGLKNPPAVYESSEAALDEIAAGN